MLETQKKSILDDVLRLGLPACAVALLLDEWRRQNFDGMAALRPVPRWMIEDGTRWSVAWSEAASRIVLTAEDNLYRANAGEADYRRAEVEYARLARLVRNAEADLKMPGSGNDYCARAASVLTLAEMFVESAKQDNERAIYAEMVERLRGVADRLRGVSEGMVRAKADWDSFDKREWRFEPKALSLGSPASRES